MKSMPTPGGLLHKNRTAGKTLRYEDSPGGEPSVLSLLEVQRGIRDGASQIFGGRRHMSGVKDVRCSRITGSGGART